MLTETTTTVTEPISLAEVKEHLRIEHDVEDALLVGLITAARQIAEDYCNLIIVPRTFQLKLDDFETPVCFPVAPIESVDSVQFYDTDGVQQTLTSYHLEKNLFTAELLPDYGTDWPEVADGFNKVTISFTAGFSSVPEVIRQAIKMIVGSLYAHRENHSEMRLDQVPLSSQVMLNTYRRITV